VVPPIDLGLEMTSFFNKRLTSKKPLFLGILVNFSGQRDYFKNKLLFFFGNCNQFLRSKAMKRNE